MPGLLRALLGSAPVGPDGQPTAAERVRLCTLKTLARPDDAANNAVVSLAQQGREAEVMDALRRRLAMPNPHKQWLAVKLLEAILQRSASPLPRLAALAAGIADQVDALVQRPPAGAEGARVRSAALEVLPLLGAGDEGVPTWAPMSPSRRGPGALTQPVTARRRGSAMYDAAAFAEHGGEGGLAATSVALVIERANEVASTAQTSAELLVDLTQGIGRAGASEVDLLDELVVRCRGAQEQLAPMADMLSAALDSPYHNDAQTALTNVLGAADALSSALANAANVTADLTHAPAAAAALERTRSLSAIGAEAFRPQQAATRQQEPPPVAAAAAAAAQPPPMQDLLSLGDSPTSPAMPPAAAAAAAAAPPRAAASDALVDLMSLDVPPAMQPSLPVALKPNATAPLSINSDVSARTAANEFDDLFGSATPPSVGFGATPPSVGFGATPPSMGGPALMQLASSPTNPFLQAGAAAVPPRPPPVTAPAAAAQQSKPAPAEAAPVDDFDAFFAQRK